MALWQSTSAIHPEFVTIWFRSLAFIGLGFGLVSTEEEIEEGEIVWAEWSPEIQPSLSRKAYVDYTAKWRASCLANKRVYQYENIKTLFEEKRLLLFVRIGLIEGS